MNKILTDEDLEVIARENLSSHVWGKSEYEVFLNGIKLGHTKTLQSLAESTETDLKLQIKGICTDVGTDGCRYPECPEGLDCVDCGTNRLCALMEAKRLDSYVEGYKQGALFSNRWQTHKEG